MHTNLYAQQVLVHVCMLITDLKFPVHRDIEIITRAVQFKMLDYGSK